MMFNKNNQDHSIISPNIRDIYVKTFQNIPKYSRIFAWKFVLGSTVTTYAATTGMAATCDTHRVAHIRMSLDPDSAG